MHCYLLFTGMLSYHCVLCAQALTSLLFLLTSPSFVSRSERCPSLSSLLIIQRPGIESAMNCFPCKKENKNRADWIQQAFKGDPIDRLDREWLLLLSSMTCLATIFRRVFALTGNELDWVAFTSA